MGKTGLILMLAILLATGAAAPPPAGGIEHVLAALDRGDAQQAETLSEAALKQETSDTRLRARLLLYHGLAVELLGAHDMAMRDLTNAIDARVLPPDEMGQAYLQRGFLRDRMGQPDEAIADYSAVIALKSYSAATAFNSRGGIHLRRGRLMDAQQDYLAALAADGGQSQYAYYGLGWIAEREGDKLAARGFYAKAVAADAGYAAAMERLSALGGPPDTVSIQPAQRIVLRAPGAGGPQASPGSLTVLHPPSGKRDGRSAESPAVPPMSPFMPVKALALRPALDQASGRVPAGHADQVQLGAWRSVSEARAAWEKTKARAGGLLDGSSPVILVAEVPRKGRYFRLRVRPISGQSGLSLCARLAAKALDCMRVRD